AGGRPTAGAAWRGVEAGAWSGRFPAGVRERFADQVSAVDRGEDIHRGGGETFAELRARTWRAMTAAVTQPFDDVPTDREARIVVFTHGGFINMAAAEALGLPPMAHKCLRGPANCSVKFLRLQVVPTDGGHRI